MLGTTNDLFIETSAILVSVLALFFVTEIWEVRAAPLAIWGPWWSATEPDHSREKQTVVSIHHSQSLSTIVIHVASAEPGNFDSPQAL